MKSCKAFVLKPESWSFSGSGLHRGLSPGQGGQRRGRRTLGLQLGGTFFSSLDSCQLPLHQEKGTKKSLRRETRKSRRYMKEKNSKDHLFFFLLFSAFTDVGRNCVRVLDFKSKVETKKKRRRLKNRRHRRSTTEQKIIVGAELTLLKSYPYRTSMPWNTSVFEASVWKSEERLRLPMQ